MADSCGAKVLPYMIDGKGVVWVFLELDSKYNEWTPFGGYCHEQHSACDDLPVEIIKGCLRRELEEESLNLLTLNDTDIGQCSYIEYVSQYRPGQLYHSRIHMVYWPALFVQFDAIRTAFHHRKKHKRYKQKQHAEASDVGIFSMDQLVRMINKEKIFPFFFKRESVEALDEMFLNGLHSVFGQQEEINGLEIISGMETHIKTSGCEMIEFNEPEKPKRKRGKKRDKKEVMA